MSTIILTRTAPITATPRVRVSRKVSEAPSRRTRRRLRRIGRLSRATGAPNARVLDLHVQSTSLWPRPYR